MLGDCEHNETMSFGCGAWQTTCLGVWHIGGLEHVQLLGFGIVAQRMGWQLCDALAASLVLETPEPTDGSEDTVGGHTVGRRSKPVYLHMPFAQSHAHS